MLLEKLLEELLASAAATARRTNIPATRITVYLLVVHIFIRLMSIAWTTSGLCPLLLSFSLHFPPLFLYLHFLFLLLIFNNLLFCFQHLLVLALDILGLMFGTLYFTFLSL